MHTLTLNIKESAYGSILYFLKNLQNDVEIVSDKVTKNNTHNPDSIKNLRGVFHSYADPSKIDLEMTISEQYIVKKYRKENL